MKQRYKIGDWVKDRYSKDWIQLKDVEETDKGNIIYNIELENKIWQKDILEKWQPTLNEWCWDNINGLIKITFIDDFDKDEFYFITMNSKDERKNFFSMSILEPFNGKLPSFLKD